MLTTALIGPSFFAAVIFLLARTVFGLGSKSSYRTLPTIPIFSTIWLFLKTRGSIPKALEHIGKAAPLNVIPILNKKVVLINDFKLGKELFHNPVFCGRPKDDQWCYHSRGSYGIINTEGAAWDEQRKFARTQLKRFGFGTKSMQAFIDTEVEEFIDELSKENGKLISPNKRFYLPMINSLWMILTGQRYANEENKICKSSLQLFSEMLESFKFPEIFTWYLPINVHTLRKLGRWIPGLFPAFTKLMVAIEDLHSYFMELIAERQKAITSQLDVPTDFVEAYLMEMKKNSETNKTTSTLSNKDGVQHLLASITDFFVAGGDTTSTMLAWCMLHLINNPQIQEKIFREIESVIGTERGPHLDDRPSCPYTEAFIYEVLRATPVTMSSLPHELIQDAIVGNYLIKKGTMIFLNIVAVHNDKKIWGDPENFRPERYISETGVFQKPEAVVTFSIGKRKCLGEQLAKDNLFLYVSAIVQRFKLEKDPSVQIQEVCLSERSGINSPKKYYMTVHDRFNAPVG